MAGERFDTFGPQPTRPEAWEAPAATDAGEPRRELDPREAAALLARTTREAGHRFEIRPPILTLAAAVAVLVAYGAAWLSVRNQHPYSGPSGTGLAVLYGTVALWIVVVVAVTRRALKGRTSRQRQMHGVVFGAIWICVYVFQGALHHAGASHSIVDGVYPAAAPLIVVGAAAAAYEAGRSHRANAGFAVAVVGLGAFASFAGAAAVWGVVGVGLCGLLLAGAAAQLWQRRAAA
jgi:hypothetical protein